MRVLLVESPQGGGVALGKAVREEVELKKGRAVGGRDLFDRVLHDGLKIRKVGGVSARDRLAEVGEKRCAVFLSE